MLLEVCLDIKECKWPLDYGMKYKTGTWEREILPSGNGNVSWLDCGLLDSGKFMPGVKYKRKFIILRDTRIVSDGK